MYNLNLLTPIMSHDLIRIGRKKDGGYVLNKRAVDKAKLLLSFGVNTDWTFEAAFYHMKSNTGVIIASYDYSVDFRHFIRTAFGYIKKAVTFKKGLHNILFSLHFLRVAFMHKLFFNRTDKKFYKKGIAREDNGLFLSFDSIMADFKSDLNDDELIVKMDIEGAEFEVLESMLQYSPYISSFVIEFHGLDINGDKLVQLIKIAKEKKFVVTHVHPNNGGGLIEKSQLPMLLEITLTKESLFTHQELTERNTRSYPIDGLDYPCVKGMQELSLAFNREQK